MTTFGRLGQASPTIGSLLVAASALGAVAATPRLAAAQTYSLSIAGSPSKAPVSDHAMRSVAAIDLAVMAAEAGLLDVSIEAMQRAVASGPPVSAADLGGLLSAGAPSPRGVSVAGQPNQQAETAKSQLAQRLMRLHEVWTQQDVEPLEAYRAWKELVLPSGRPNEAFAYSVATLLSR
ncbi:MAG: hypothetical protein AAF961_19940, partial [Planctomycetota bacterium]